MFDVVLERIGTVIVSVAGVVMFVLMIVLLPFAFVFMLILESVIQALDFILSRMSSDEYDKERWKGSER